MAIPLPAPAAVSVEDFFAFLFSDELNPPIRSEVHQEMSAPFSHYFVFTGHNSYLTGNQLSSVSSDIPIKTALQNGVRVIELDMWPNSSKDGVDILHGRTLTSPVEMIKCLRTINEYAFVASTYPLVITLEDHLTPDLQAKVAEMISETFGDCLHIPASETVKEFPSPESLKNKIIISTKPPKEYLESQYKGDKHQKNPEHSGVLESESYREETQHSGPLKLNFHQSDSQRKPRLGSLKEKTNSLEKDIEDLNGSQESDDYDEERSDDDDPVFAPSTNDRYRKLIAIPAGKPKGGLKEALKVDPEKVRRLSLSETQLAKAVTSHGIDIVRFTQRNILRVYPRGTRLNSSNYDPFIAWMHGAQMVAFNMQSHDKALWSMEGFFRANGKCGYVKKPDFLLKMGEKGEVFDPKASLPTKTTLKVKVYMGDGWRKDFSSTHFDTFSPPDFYTRVGIAGVPNDSVMKKTRRIEDQWVPVWNEEFTFPLTVPEIAVLRIEVRDYDVSDKHDFGGQTCLPVSELRAGIRCVSLYDRKGVKYKSVRLLMRFQFQ